MSTKCYSALSHRLEQKINHLKENELDKSPLLKFWKVLWTDKVEPDKIVEFKQQLEQSGLLQQIYQETGNMTTRVTLELPNTSYTWSWSGVGVTDRMPLPLKKWYQEVDRFCKAVKK